VKRYRVGGKWRLTIVEFDDAQQPNERGHRPSDRLLGMAITPEDAKQIVDALNVVESYGAART
jgi:hypothetical protein